MHFKGVSLNHFFQDNVIVTLGAMTLSSVNTYVLLCLIISKVYLAWHHCGLQKKVFILEDGRSSAVQSVTEHDVMGRV